MTLTIEKTAMITRFGVVGAGAWGTALAQMLADNKGRDAPAPSVTLWAHESDVVDSINQCHENKFFLSGVALSHGIVATQDLFALGACEALLIVVPVPHLRSLLARLPSGSAPVILCSKGMEAGSFDFPIDMAQQICPDRPLAVLSGPTFAHEVANGLPTATALACADAALGVRLRESIARPYFRPYSNEDVIGTEIGGVVKNVLAIACGIAEGAGLGKNAHAALIARGFTEMTRFGLARGAQLETLAGLAGLGDMVLTCSSTKSRNFALGVGLGRGESPEKLLTNRRTIAEGAHSAPVLAEAARAEAVDMPIITMVADLLAGRYTVAQAVTNLLSRSLSSEWP